MITPILKDPKAHGGTLYTFPSASRDLTRAFTNSEYEFAFSHFVCLNLPDFRYGKYVSNDSDSESDIYDGEAPKGIYLNDLYNNSIDAKHNNINTALKWHMQSYVMNYEVAILNRFSLDSKKYDSEILRTPSERIFFNWLQKVNGIKIKGEKYAYESLDGYGYNIGYELIELDDENLLQDADKGLKYRIGNKLYEWKGGEWRSRVLVDKTVQYIGTIDMVNNVNIDSDSFNEIYLNIPSNAGRSTNVVFNNIFDDNYGEKGDEIDVDDDIYQKYIDNDKGSYYIIGRDKNSQSPDNHTLQAIFDDNEQHKYIIESGYCIDFNDKNYSGENGSVGIDVMNLDSNEDFEFNCVLIYYRIRKGTNQWYTNLYGVLFLEEVTISEYNTNNADFERAGYIQRYPKFKKGNSWGLKLDLKIDAQPDSQMELREKEYDDPNGGGDGMQLFAEALVQLNDCSKLFYEVKKENTDIEERLYTLENIVSGVDTVYDLRNEVGVLRTKIEMLQPSVDSINGRMDELDEKLSKIQNSLGSFIDKISKLDNIFNYKLIFGSNIN